MDGPAFPLTVAPFGQTGAPLTPTDTAAPGAAARRAAIQIRTSSCSKSPKVPFGASGFPAFAGTMAVERVATGLRWAEGPVYFPAGRYVLFSDIPNNRIMRLSEDDGHFSVFRQPSMNSNGNTIDREGRLITCEHSGRRVTRTELDGSITIIADKYNGKKLNSPNDVVVASDGSIWFTDPAYGIGGYYEGVKAAARAGKAQRLPGRSEIRRHQSCRRRLRGAQRHRLLARREEALCHRYRLHRRSGQPVAYPRVRRGCRGRQGVEQQSLCRNAQAQHYRRDALPTRTAASGAPWAGAIRNEDGVRCYTPGGELLGKIHIPETVANLCFGGKHRNRLYICGSTSLYAVYTSAQGAMKP